MTAIKKSKKIQHGFITSDCNKMIKLAFRNKIFTIKRPPNLALAKSTSENTLRHAINYIIEKYSLKYLKKEIDVNLIAAFAMIKHFGTIMSKKKNGSIINIGSDLSLNAPDQSVYHQSEDIKKVKNFKPIGYSLSKFGIIGLTKYIATYWGHKNVRCNALVLGAVENRQPKFLKKNVSKRIPLKRWAKKYEYKKALQFLASNDSAYMTGQMLVIDGGRSTW